MTRQQSHLPVSVKELIVKQLAIELKNKIFYNNLAGLASSVSLEGHVKYFCKRQKEEELHFKWFKEFLMDSGVSFVIPNVESVAPAAKFESDVTLDLIADLHDQVLTIEIETTKEIETIYQEALNQKNYVTVEFLHRLLAEQLEEEATSHKALDLCGQAASVIELDTVIGDLL